MNHAPVPGPAGSKGRPGPASWLAARPYFVACLAGFLVMAVMVLSKKATEFEWAYVLSARNLLAGRGLYQLKVPPFRSYTYPPFMAAMAIPFALVPKLVGRVAWLLVCLGSFVAVFRGCWRLSGGGRLDGAGRWTIDPAEHRIALLGLACAVSYMESGVSHQQTDLLIAALLTAGCLGLTRSRDILAGVSFGVAAGMKCTPLLWAPYLAWRGRWKAAALVPAVALAVNLLPDGIRAADGGGWWLGAWFDQFLRPFGRPDYLPGRWFAWILDNQSLSGCVGRWASTCCVWGPGGGVEVVGRASPLSAQSVRPLAFGLEGIVLLLAWLGLHRGRALARRLPGGGGPLREPTEFGVVMLLMVLLSPMSSRPHFVVNLLPAFCLARQAVSGGRRALYGPLAVSAATAFLGLSIWGPSVGRLTMWCGVLTWGSLSLLAGCLWSLAVPAPAPDVQAPRSKESDAVATPSMRRPGRGEPRPSSVLPS